jgi:CBS domain-containing protein
MSLKTLIKPGLVSCLPTATIRECAQLMEHSNVGAVLVVDDGKPVGIITDRDIALRCVAKGNDCDGLNVQEIMTTTVDTVSEEEGLFQVIEKMKQKKVRRIPITNQSGEAVGLVSFGDILELLVRELHGLAGPAIPENKKIHVQAA